MACCAVKNLSDRILHLAHSLRRQPAYDGERRSIRSKVRGLHIGDFWFGSTVFCEGPRQVARIENRRQLLQGKRDRQLTPRRHRQQACVFDAEGVASDGICANRVDFRFRAIPCGRIDNVLAVSGKASILAARLVDR